MSLRANEEGATFVELLVVVAAIALAGFGAFRFFAGDVDDGLGDMGGEVASISGSSTVTGRSAGGISGVSGALALGPPDTASASDGPSAAALALDGAGEGSGDGTGSAPAPPGMDVPPAASLTETLGDSLQSQLERQVGLTAGALAVASQLRDAALDPVGTATAAFQDTVANVSAAIEVTAESLEQGSLAPWADAIEESINRRVSAAQEVADECASGSPTECGRGTAPAVFAVVGGVTTRLLTRTPGRRSQREDAEAAGVDPRTPDAAIAAGAAQPGWTYVGEGNTGWVFRDGDDVVKIFKPDMGEGATEAGRQLDLETDFWHLTDAQRQTYRDTTVAAIEELRQDRLLNTFIPEVRPEGRFGVRQSFAEGTPRGSLGDDELDRMARSDREVLVRRAADRLGLQDVHTRDVGDGFLLGVDGNPANFLHDDLGGTAWIDPIYITPPESLFVPLGER